MSRGEYVVRRPKPNPFAALGMIVPLFLVGFAAWIAWQGFYTVAPHEQAVVLRFGKYKTTAGPGLHFKVPILDEAVRVTTSEHSIRMPYGITEEGRNVGFDLDRNNQDESLILTGDLYSGVVEWNVNWRVARPDQFIFSINREHIDSVIAAVAMSTMHKIVGDYTADQILTGKREQIAISALKETQATLDRYECGVEIVDLQMQRVIPPRRVRPAFDEVNASIQERDRLVNEANREKNQLLPAAEAEADSKIRQAEGYAARRRAESSGEIAALLAKYREYKLAPDVTRERLYIEAMERVMAGSGQKIILDGDLKNMLPLLNLGTAQETK